MESDSGPQVLKASAMLKPTYTIGRQPDNNLQIVDIRISSYHCTILNSDGVFSILDTSTNGTFLNKVLIGKGKQADLCNGDIIHIVPHETLKEDEEKMFSFWFENSSELIRKWTVK